MLDAPNVRLAVMRKKALREGGEGLVELALRLGSEGAEHQRRLAGLRYAGVIQGLGMPMETPPRVFSRAP
ncbi:hypothetical protein V3W47_02980 [Deinococcus sp. YIM 134068]|uniref:hypothetical protein n=1 Tax=Deinococcus lichenicola TaxID=3118910 RepID=UPI002F955977